MSGHGWLDGWNAVSEKFLMRRECTGCARAAEKISSSTEAIGTSEASKPIHSPRNYYKPLVKSIKEIIEGIAAGVNLGHHLIEDGTEFLYSDLLFCADENARSIFPCNPRILEFLQCVIT